MTHPMPRAVLMLALAACWACAAGAAEPLVNAHAHNDYEHNRPLLDALAHGFCSVEADIHLVDGALLVAHDLEDVAPGRTLEALYLAPLRERVTKNGGSVYGDGTPLQLLVDVKSEAEAAYAALRPVLARYRELLTAYEDGKVRDGAVTVVLSGNRPIETVAAEPQRLVFIDGRLPDLGRDVPAHLMPLVSARWGSEFRWSRRGGLTGEDRERLASLVRTCHAEGKRLRFWATPEDAALWRVLRDAGVDYINTDRLAALQRFLRARSRK